jgi:hypothetical protein
MRGGIARVCMPANQTGLLRCARDLHRSQEFPAVAIAGVRSFIAVPKPAFTEDVNPIKVVSTGEETLLVLDARR